MPIYTPIDKTSKENPTFDTFIKLAVALDVDLSEIFNFSHKGKSVKELRDFITGLIRAGNEEKLELTARVLRAIYM